ncbi:hypothetical protein [Acidithiobacillus ferrivorans]|uniref:Uncharacterized protein n=1 Tax=Acidithiobacillus ferrivorans TaxID=160808 RepID=A0A7T5BII2_9PROT|nr:hypothetical protein [Acidithiobacillus ferrivorans]QQD73645.1 hypothetical protein H2515_05165 [Acidithiobacillus ferrivorans]
MPSCREFGSRLSDAWESGCAVDNPLLASHIIQVRALKDGEIFLLKDWDGSSQVLKAEPQAPVVTGRQDQR